MAILGIFGAILLYNGNADYETIAGWILVFVAPSPVIAFSNMMKKE